MLFLKVRDFRIVCGKISLFDRSRDFSWRSKKSWPKRKNNYKKLKCRKETHEKEGIYSLNNTNFKQLFGFKKCAHSRETEINA
jgi:hypothetical protein